MSFFSLPPPPQPQLSTLKCRLTVSKQTRSLTILNLADSNIRLLSEDSTRIDNEKIYRKYYSKKVSNLLTYYRKSLHSISKYPCKTTKHLKVYGSALKRSPIASLKTLALYYGVNYGMKLPNFDSALHSKKSTFLDQIPRYKSLETLTFLGGSREISLYPLRTLPKLRTVSLTLMTHQVTANTKTLLGLPLLERFNLTVKNPNITLEKNFHEEVVQFCVQLLSSKTLKSVRLGLTSFEDDPQALDLLLENIDKFQVPAFDILISLFSGTVDANKVQAALNHLDLLMLISTNGHIVSLNNCDSIKNKNTSPDQAQRKLQLILSIYEDPVDPEKTYNTQLSEVSERLFALFGKTLGIPFLLDAISAQNLRGLAFPILPAYMRLYVLICPALAEVLKNAPGLKQLALEKYFFDLEENEDYKEIIKAFDQLSKLQELESLAITKMLISNISFPSFEKLLAPLKSLKSLELDIDIEMHIKDPNISLSLETLANLEKLILGFNIQKYLEPINLSFPYNTLYKLTDLQIKLPKLTEAAKMDFAAILEKLSSLERFSVTQGCQLLEEPSVKSTILKNIGEHRKLRNVSFVGSFWVSFGSDSEAIAKERRKLGTEMIGEIKKIFRKTAIIERWIVMDIGCYEIDIMR